MAAPQKVTRDNFTTLLVRSTNARGSTPNGNVYFDTANDKLQLITLDELATVDLGSGLEANPLTSSDKIQALALYFFVLQEVQADPTLQQFRISVDAVSNRMGKLVGATAFLNAITLDTNTTTTNLDDRDKIADSGFTEFAVGGVINAIYHGVKSLTAINATTQPFYMLAASLSETDRQAATPIDFDQLGDINSVIKSYTNGGSDDLNSVLIIGAREFGYTIGETNSTEAGVAELGAYSQGYGIGNSIVSSIAALTQADVFGGLQVAPYTGLGFFINATSVARTGFVEADGNFRDKITNTGGASLLQIRAWMDMLMQQDTDQNDNTGVTGVFRPKRAEPLYTIDGATGKLVTRAGLYIENLSAADEQSIIQTDDLGNQKTYPFNSGVVITVSQAWLTDTLPWYRLMYNDAAGLNDFDTANAITVKDSSGTAISGNATNATGTTISVSYAYDVETAGGNVTAGADQDVVLQIGGVDTSKTRTIPFTITRSSTIPVDASTDAETN